MRRALKVAAAVLVLAVAFALAVGYHAASWLKKDDPPVKADAIVVLAGSWSRSLHAADLYRAGYAPRVVLSEVGPDEGEQLLASLGIVKKTADELRWSVLVAKGVPEKHIDRLGAPVLSTADEAERIAARFGRSGKRILVVTSPSHIFRARMIIERALRGRGVELVFCATPYEAFPDAWWRSQDAARQVLLEWAKILFYLVGGHFRAPAPA